MRPFVLVLLVACGGTSSSNEPRCVDALTKLAKALGDGKAPELAPLIGRCEQQKWTPAQRKCLAEAPSTNAAVTCVLGAAEPIAGPRPSADVKKLVAGAKPPVRALLFTVHGNEQVTAYMKELGVVVELADPIMDIERAKQYRITKDTLVLLGDGDRYEKIERLSQLDREIGLALPRLLRVSRQVYITSGHGEITSADEKERKTSKLRQQIDAMFAWEELPREQLASGVPDDADIVVILGPVTSFAPAEQAHLARYLDRGGALLLALDPKGISSLESIDGKLGVKLAKGHLVDDKNFMPQKQVLSDRRIVLTNKFSAHASTASLGRTVNKALVLLDAGVLESVPAQATKSITIRSMPESFVDHDGDHTFDAGRETRASYDLAAAIEGPKFRAVVIADADVFADALVPGGGGHTAVIMIGGPLLADSLRWLAREDAFAPAPPDEPPPKPSAAEVARRELTRSIRALENKPR